MDKSQAEILAIFKDAQARAANQGFAISDEALQELIPEYGHELHPVDICDYLVLAWQLGRSPLETYRQCCERDKEPEEQRLRRYMKEAQASMAIEGYIISDEDSERNLQEYMRDPSNKEVLEIAKNARRLGKPVADAIMEYYRRKEQKS